MVFIKKLIEDSVYQKNYRLQEQQLYKKHENYPLNNSPANL